VKSIEANVVIHAHDQGRMTILFSCLCAKFGGGGGGGGGRMGGRHPNDLKC
jgi:hypothetical protein